MDYMTLVAIAVGASALWLLLGRRPPAAVAQRPGRRLIEYSREVGLDAAGRKIESRLGDAEADDFFRRMRGAFAPEAAPPAAPKD